MAIEGKRKNYSPGRERTMNEDTEVEEQEYLEYRK